MLRIGYGEGNFENLRKDKCLFIDKTHFIPKMEPIKKFFFIRPRRFGKSLWLSLLKSYYDINAKDKFDTLFADLYIQKNPTELRNTYLTLYLNFSGIRGDDFSKLQKSFDYSVNLYVDSFIQSYKKFLPHDSLERYRAIVGNLTAADIVGFILNEVEKTSYKIYVLIDEYDHFVNTLVAEGRDATPLFISRESGGERSGFVRHFYEKLKIGSDSGVMERFFMTGVSPIMLDELSSGFNIMTNMTTDKRFNEMLGFSRDEVNSILDRIPPEKYESNPREQVLYDLQHYYDGYLFSPGTDTTLFNTDMVLYFVEKFQSYGYPEEILDMNVKTDYEKLQGRIVGVSGREELQRTIENIVNENTIRFNLVERFTFKHRFGHEELNSLLFYLGLLTKSKKPFTYVVPNHVVRKLFWEYLQMFLRIEKNIAFDSVLLHDTIADMAESGKIEKLHILISEFYQKKLSNYDFSNHSEKHVKFMLVAYFTLSGIYNIISERELPGGKRIDLLYEGNPAYDDYIKYNYIMELKYINKEKESQGKEIREKAIEQVKEYYNIYTENFQRKNKKTKALLIMVKYTKESELIEIV
ncbi:MAG: AAA family ATPase [Leptospiraceae bacterium]|nr:AAA family ATPase [Leptospiraceae bacterium]MCP5499186.1 AAA family ATPase [Leptospiraceae bacterium]